jgi:hypothetical protein
MPAKLVAGPGYVLQYATYPAVNVRARNLLFPVALPELLNFLDINSYRPIHPSG